MNRFFLCLIFLSFFSTFLWAQTNLDTLRPVTDTLKKALNIEPSVLDSNTTSSGDSVSRRPVTSASGIPTLGNNFFKKDFNREILSRHPYFGFSSPPMNNISDKINITGKEEIFYSLIGLLLVFALLKHLFPKYFNDLFRLFFRTTLKYKQIREQLMQSKIPSFLFDGFFVITSALYIDFLLLNYQLIEAGNFWQMFFYSALAITGIYLVKFLGLKLSGWIFGAQEATDSYSFVVFVVNKMIGIYLLPFLILLAFSKGDVYKISLAVSWCGIGVLFLYRLILSYGAARNQIRFNSFHFFLYVCAFEIAPLLLIAKLLLHFFSRTA